MNDPYRTADVWPIVELPLPQPSTAGERILVKLSNTATGTAPRAFVAGQLDGHLVWLEVQR